MPFRTSGMALPSLQTPIPDLRNGIPTPSDTHSGPPEWHSNAVGHPFRTSGMALPSLQTPVPDLRNGIPTPSDTRSGPPERMRKANKKGCAPKQFACSTGTTFFFGLNLSYPWMMPNFEASMKEMICSISGLIGTWSRIMNSESNKLALLW